MVNELLKKNYKLCTNGSDNHLILIDLRDKKITGSKIEKICDFVDISINKNAVPGDKSALTPGGIRIGTPALTSRGLEEKDFIKVTEYLDKAIKIGIEIQIISGNKLQDFVNELSKNEDLIQLKKEINEFSEKFEFYEE